MRYIVFLAFLARSLTLLTVAEAEAEKTYGLRNGDVNERRSERRRLNCDADTLKD